MLHSDILTQTFIAHSESDYRHFNRIFIDTPEAINRRARVTVWYRPHNDATLAGPPLAPHEVSKFD